MTTLGLDKPTQAGPPLIRLAEWQLEAGYRSWAGNDEKGHNTHHGIVNLHESPLDIKLEWRSHTGQLSLVGCYRLDLQSLLNAGYIRKESGRADAVRLKFVHDNGAIYLRVRRDTPAIYLGGLES